MNTNKSIIHINKLLEIYLDLIMINHQVYNSHAPPTTGAPGWEGGTVNCDQ